MDKSTINHHFPSALFVNVYQAGWKFQWDIPLKTEFET